LGENGQIRTSLCMIALEWRFIDINTVNRIEESIKGKISLVDDGIMNLKDQDLVGEGSITLYYSFHHLASKCRREEIVSK